MAGHSHSANIAVKKGKVDRLRARVFSKLSRDIMVAARGGPDPNFNFGLRHAVEAARAQSMPNDKIDYAIKKGAGLLEGIKVSEVIIEAYGPGGVAMLVECLTDNPNRTRPEIGGMFDKANGKLGAANSVLWMFKRRGLIVVKTADIAEDKLMDIVLAAGAEDLTQAGDVFEILTTIETFDAVRKALEEATLKTTLAEKRYFADNEIEVKPETAQKILTLIENVEEHDDVNAVHTSMKFTDEVIALIEKT
jgi:YebC/PmpR family DNA-binding regulatory protein